MLATTGFRIPRYWSMKRIDYLDEQGNQYSIDRSGDGIKVHVRSPTHAFLCFDSVESITVRAPDGYFRRELDIESFWIAPCGTHGILWCKG